MLSSTVVRQKGESQDGGNKKKLYTPNIQKNEKVLITFVILNPKGVFLKGPYFTKSYYFLVFSRNTSLNCYFHFLFSPVWIFVFWFLEPYGFKKRKR